ncbi:ribonuclease H-like domain-containing protein, partial [Tanacetum coccineum]
MKDKYTALIKNNTWTLVPRPSEANIVRYMWLFRHKYLADGTLSHYKACLMANGNTQLSGINVDETFSPVVKPDTIRTVLSLAISRHCPVHQLDVKNAFLHGDLSKMRSLYGLKQASRAWFQRFAAYITRRKYATEILERAHMVGCNSSRTPVDTDSKLGDDGARVPDLTLYRSLAGSLQYLTFTCPDISYAVQQMHIGLVVLLLRDRLLFREEYRDIANVVAETCWLRNLLRELHTPLSSTTLVYCDNVTAVYLSSNPVRVLHVPSPYQYADIFTKDLSSAFEEFGTGLSVRCPSAPTTGSKDVKPTKKVSNSNPFDVLNSVENDVDLGNNGGTSNLASKEANHSGSSIWNLETSSPNTTPSVDNNEKFKKLIIDGQATLVDDE